MNINGCAQGSTPIYGKIPSPILSTQERKIDKTTITVCSNKKIELPLEIVYIIFESHSNILELPLRCMLVSVHFYNAVCSFLRKPSAQREWLKIGFNQYHLYGAENYAKKYQARKDNALKNMKHALEGVNHISFDLVFSEAEFINNNFNECKIEILKNKKDIVTLYLDINFKFQYISENEGEIGDRLADNIAMILLENPLQEIKLSIKGQIFSVNNFSTILEAIRKKVDAKVKISLADCMLNNEELKEIALHLDKNIIDFELMQDGVYKISSEEGEEGVHVTTPAFKLFDSKLVNAKRITVQPGCVELRGMIDFCKIINDKLEELNLIGFRLSDRILLEDFYTSFDLGNEEVEYLALTLKDTAKNIKRINLSLNNIDDNAIEYLLDLMSIEGLKKIDLSWNNFTFDGIFKILQSLLENGVEEIDISSHELTLSSRIKGILLDILGAKNIRRSQEIFLENPYAEASYIYYKETYQIERKDGGGRKNINVLIAKELYLSYKYTLEHLKFRKVSDSENSEQIAQLEHRAQRFAAGQAIDYEHEDVISVENYDFNGQEDEGASSDESESEDSIPPEIASFMRVLDFNSAKN